MDEAGLDKSSRILLLYTKLLHGEVLRKGGWKSGLGLMGKASRGI